MPAELELPAGSKSINRVGRVERLIQEARESAMEYSPTHIPDVGVLYHSNDGKHLLGDTKVVTPSPLPLRPRYTSLAQRRSPSPTQVRA